MYIPGPSTEQKVCHTDTQSTQKKNYLLKIMFLYIPVPSMEQKVCITRRIKVVP